MGMSGGWSWPAFTRTISLARACVGRIGASMAAALVAGCLGCSAGVVWQFFSLYFFICSFYFFTFLFICLFSRYYSFIFFLTRFIVCFLL